MNPIHYYRSRIEELKINIRDIKRIERWLSILRLLSFIATVVLVFVLAELTQIVAWIGGLFGIIVFGCFLKRHLSTSRRRQHLEILLEINQKEFDAVNGKFNCFANGDEFSE